MKNLNRKSAIPPFKKTCPCTILPHPFFNCSDSLPPPGEVIKIYSPPLKNGEGGPTYAVSSSITKLLSYTFLRLSAINYV